MIVNENEADKIQVLLNRCADQAMELGCDSIRIIATASKKEESTISFHTGAGNLFAQHGSVIDWLNGQRDIGTAHEIANAIDGREE